MSGPLENLHDPASKIPLHKAVHTPSITSTTLLTSFAELEPTLIEKAQLSPQVISQDWNGEDDPENPENWSSAWKAYHILYVGLQCFMVTFGSSIFALSVRQVSHHFHVGLTAATLPISVYVLGLALGPAISAPISEKFGRKIVYLSLFPISMLFTLGAGLAKSFATLLVCRLLSAALSSGVFAVGPGTTSDLYTPLAHGAVISVSMVMPFAGPAFGPVVGGYLAQYKPLNSFRWTQYTIVFAGSTVLIMGLFQHETYKKVILQKRAKRLGLNPPPNPMEKLSGAQKLKLLLTITITRPVIMLFTDPIIAFAELYTGFNLRILFAFFAAFPIVFRSPYPQIQVYHFTPSQTGLVYLAIGLGCLIACMIYYIDYTLVYLPLARNEIAKGKSGRGLLLPPESRCRPAMIGSIMLPISLFWFAWTARSDVHWIVPVMACVPFGIGNLLVFFTAVLYQIDCFGPMMSNSAMIANGIVRYALGAVFPLFARQMYLAMSVKWATSLLGFVTVLLLPLPWLASKYGHNIRVKSKFAEYSKDI